MVLFGGELFTSSSTAKVSWQTISKDLWRLLLPRNGLMNHEELSQFWFSNAMKAPIWRPYSQRRENDGWKTKRASGLHLLPSSPSSSAASSSAAAASLNFCQQGSLRSKRNTEEFEPNISNFWGFNRWFFLLFSLESWTFLCSLQPVAKLVNQRFDQKLVNQIFDQTGYNLLHRPNKNLKSNYL